MQVLDHIVKGFVGLDPNRLAGFKKHGFLVPLGDVNALADAMERFIVDPDLILKMGEASREFAAEKFDVKKVNSLILKKMGL